MKTANNAGATTSFTLVQSVPLTRRCIGLLVTAAGQRVEVGIAGGLLLHAWQGSEDAKLGKLHGDALARLLDLEPDKARANRLEG